PPVRDRVQVVPPEELRAGEAGDLAARGFPDLFAGDETVRLPPEPDLRQVAEVPAVADDAMLPRQRAGEHAGLCATGDSGEHRAERGHEALASQRGQRGCDGPAPELIERHPDLGLGRPERAVEIAVDRAVEMDAPGAVAREALDRLGKVVAVAATVTGTHLVEIAGLVEGRQTRQRAGVAGIAQFERA